MAEQSGDLDARHRLARVVRGADMPALVACALALGVFFTWFETAFRAASPLLDQAQAQGWLAFAQADVAWVTSLAAGAACSALAAAWLSRRSKDAPSPTRSERCGIVKNALSLLAGLVASAGTCLVAWASDIAQAQVCGGALCALGSVALLACWMTWARRFSADEALLAILLSVVVSITLTGAVSMLIRSYALVLLAASPLIAAAIPCAARYARHPQPEASQAPTAETSPATETYRLLDPQTVIALMALAVSYLVLGIIGIDMDMTVGSGAYHLVNLAGMLNLALLALTALGPKRTHPDAALALIVGASVALMPASLAFLGEGPCFVLTKTAGFCACGLIMLQVVAEQAPGPRGLSHGLVRLSLAQAAMLVGIVSGDAIRRQVGAEHVTQVFPLVAVALLYLVLVIYVVFAAGGSRRVIHVISGSFNDEAELARVRRDVILAEHPDVSARESDVLLLLLQDFGTQRIAAELCVSENTVKTHVRHLYAKLGINSRQQLLALGRQTTFKAGKTAKP